MKISIVGLNLNGADQGESILIECWIEGNGYFLKHNKISMVFKPIYLASIPWSFADSCYRILRSILISYVTLVKLFHTLVAKRRRSDFIHKISDTLTHIKNSLQNTYFHLPYENFPNYEIIMLTHNLIMKMDVYGRIF